MLVLSRRKGEKIIIGGDVIVEVLEIRPDQVRLSFHAPKEVAIDRLEIHESKMKEKRDGKNP